MHEMVGIAGATGSSRRRPGAALALLLGIAVVAAGCAAPVRSNQPETATVVATSTATPLSSPSAASSTPPAATPTVEPYATAAVSLEPGVPASEGPCWNPYLDQDLPASAAPVIVGPPGPVPALPTFAPAPLDRDADLERRLRERLGSDEASFGVFVKRLADGRGATVNPDRVFYAASTFKVSVMYEAFRQRALGLLDFGEQYRVTDYYADFNAGYALLATCQTTTLGDAISAMMSVSDNIAANFIKDRVSGRNINADFDALGMPSTRIASDMPATPADLGTLMEAIYRGHGLSDADARQMLALMGTDVLTDRIPSGLPEGIGVAHKTGNYSNATNDVGIVFAPSGPYVITLLSEWGFDSGAAQVEADLSRIVYDYFEGSGPADGESGVTGAAGD